MYDHEYANKMVVNEQILSTLKDIDENDKITYVEEIARVFSFDEQFGHCINIFL